MRNILVILMILITALSFSSCSSQNKNSEMISSSYSTGSSNAEIMDSYDYDYAQEETGAPMEMPERSGSPISSDVKMFIKTAQINLNTDSFDQTMDTVRNTVSLYGGYFENSNLYMYESNKVKRRIYNATIRVPVEDYETVKSIIENSAVLELSSESSEEVSGEYFNIKSRLETLRVEEERLLEFIKDAADLDKVIEFEKRLTEVRNQIDVYEANLARLESLTSYSTIVVNITETQYEEKTDESNFFSRIKKGFTDSAKATLHFFQNVIIFAAYILVPGLIIGLLVLVGVLIYKRRKKGE